MSTFAKDTKATVIPCLRYRDAPAAIEWLCRAFGFEKHLVVPGPDGTVAHAQLSFGNGMIMLGSVVESEFGRLMKQPDEIGGAETQTPYVIVSDADAVYSSAKAAGAKIELDIKDEDYGGRGFSCRDPEGHLWNLGTYDPWASDRLSKLSSRHYSRTRNRAEAAAVAIGRLLQMPVFGLRRLDAAFPSGLHDLCPHDDASVSPPPRCEARSM